MTKTITLSTELKEYATQLKNSGFDVYLPEGENPTYCHFVKDNNIGYVENTSFGFNFSSVHKPNHESGTGFGIHREIYNPTIEMANNFFCIKPNGIGFKSPVKYKDWEDYLKYPTNQIINKLKY